MGLQQIAFSIFTIQTLLLSMVESSCRELWYNKCDQNSDCCSANCSRSVSTWLYGVCSPNVESSCKELWYNKCNQNSDCCSANCSRSVSTWLYGVCSPNVEPTTETPLNLNLLEDPAIELAIRMRNISIEQEIEDFLLASATPKADITTYTKYVNGLLFSANNFEFHLNPLPCTDIDPTKKYAIQFPTSRKSFNSNSSTTENEEYAIRLCDLCPSLPLGKISNTRFEPLSNQSIINVLRNSDYGDCIAQCVGLPNCMALNFYWDSQTCFHFSSTRGDLSSQTRITFVTVSQPIGMLGNWIFSRNTRISTLTSSINNDLEDMDHDQENEKLNNEQIQVPLTFQNLSFLDCVAECDERDAVKSYLNNGSICKHVSYSQMTRECQLFFSHENGTETSGQVDYEYGYLTTFDVRSGSDERTSEAWRFQKINPVLEHSDTTQVDELSQYNFTSEDTQFGLIDNPGCKLQPMEGCEGDSGKQKCQFPENLNSTQKSNLPLCPGSRYALYKKIEENNQRFESCLRTCISSQNCIGVKWHQFNLTGSSDYICTLVTLNSLVSTYSQSQSQSKFSALSNLGDFHALQIPTIRNSSSSHLSLWSFSFYPGYQLDPATSSLYPSKSSIKNISSFDQCLNYCNEQSECQRFSFDYESQICVASKHVTIIKENSTSILFVKRPPVNNPAFIFKHLIETGFSPKYSNTNKIDNFKFSFSNEPSILKFQKENTIQNCFMICLTLKMNQGKDCDFFEILYKFPQDVQKNKMIEATCEFYNLNSTEGIFERRKGSELFIRNGDLKYLNFTQEELDKIPFFQPSDFYSCFRKPAENSFVETHERLYSLNEEISDINSSSLDPFQSKQLDIFSRQKRGFFDFIVNKIIKPIAKAVVDTVVDTVKTVVKVGESVGKVFKGDFQGAKKSIMEAPIVQDAIELGKSAVTFVKAVGSGKNVGESLLDVGTNLAGFIPLPGGKGVKVIGKVLKGEKKAAGNIAKKSKDEVTSKKKSKGDQEKKKESEKDKDKEKKKESDKDKDKDKDTDQCSTKNTGKSRQGRAATGPTGNKKRPLNCNQDNTCTYKTNSPTSGKPILIPGMDKQSSSSCRQIELKAKEKSRNCHFLCKAGYDENHLKPVCRRLTRNEADWEVEPKCNEADCGTIDPVHGTTSIAVTAPHPLISKPITTYFVKYDSRRKLPIWSASYHDKFNYFNPIAGQKLKRSNNFKEHPCNELTNKQLSKEDYKGKHPFIRGHLTPYQAVANLGKKAGDNSFLLINIAPQETWTNSAPWGNTVEDHTYCFLKKKGPGIVITGVCPGSLKTTSTNFPRPTCFWKLVCYKDRDKGETRVVGFVAPNSIPTSKEDRKKKTIELKSQKQVIAEVDQSGAGRQDKFSFSKAWVDAGLNLIKGRDVGVSPLSCSQALDLPPNFGAVWEKGKNKRRKREVGNLEVFGCNKKELEEYKTMISAISVPEQNDEENEGTGDRDDDDDSPTSGGSTFASSSCGKRLIGYYPSWGTKKFSNVQGKSLTHVVFAFFETFSDGSIALGSADSVKSTDPAKDTQVAKERLANFLRVCRNFPHLKSMFAVGGWENSQFMSSIAANAGKRSKFIASALQIIDQYNFDGIDIDWEYPATGGAVEGISEDKENYVTLMKELRSALDGHQGNGGRSKKYLISFAGAAGQWTLDPGFDLRNLLKYADWANVMTYDYFGAWASKWGAYTGSPSPLFFGNPKGFSGKVNADWTIKYYVCKTKKPHQINMGIPFYGRFWENVGDPINPKDGMWRMAEKVDGVFKGGFVPWKDIQKNYMNDPSFKHELHEEAKVPYAFSSSKKVFLGYENPKSLEFKVKYAEDYNVGGLMIWAIDQDDNDYSMMSVLMKANLCKITDPNKYLHRCPPIDEKRWWTPEDGYDKAGMCGKSSPLYKGYYPVCDPDDPGYSCCGAQGYCGSGPEFCDCPTCIDYRKNPEKIIEEPTKPSQPIRWYISTDADGKRGRCGRDIPLLNGQVPICNPDDPNSHCCSNGGYCGSGEKFCECEQCINFKKDPNFVFKEKVWWSWGDGADKSGRCGDGAPKINGKMAQCDPRSKDFCCSANGWCGHGAESCDCKGCVNYSRQ